MESIKTIDIDGAIVEAMIRFREKTCESFLVYKITIGEKTITKSTQLPCRGVGIEIIQDLNEDEAMKLITESKELTNETN